MPVTGPIFALDLGQRAGFAVGAPGRAPRSGAVILKDKKEPRRVACGNLIAFLQAEWSTSCPSLVVTVSPMTLGAFFDMHSSEANVRLQYGLQAIVEGMCERFGLPLEEINEATVRKHFIGKGRMGDRESTKLAVVSRCQVLGLMRRGSEDNDRADAIAVHDWACATFGRRAISTSKLVFFGERAAAS